MPSDDFYEKKNTFWSYFEFLKSLAYKKFSCEELAEEAFNFALDKFAEDDWRRLKAFCGDSGDPRQFKSFLRTTFSRLYNDYYIKIYGKKYIPKEIKDLGSPYIETYKELCHKREVIDRIIQKICGNLNHQECANAVEKAAQKIIADYPNCGQQGPIWTDQPVDDSASNAFDFEEAMIEKETMGHIVTLLQELGVIDAEEAFTPQLQAKWEKFRLLLKIKEKEKLFLKALAEHAEKDDGCKINISDVGRIFFKYKPNKAFSIFNYLRKKITTALNKSGLGATFN